MWVLELYCHIENGMLRVDMKNLYLHTFLFEYKKIQFFTIFDYKTYSRTARRYDQPKKNRRQVNY